MNLFALDVASTEKHKLTPKQPNEMNDSKIQFSDKMLDSYEKTVAFIRLFGTQQYKKALQQWAKQRHHEKDLFSEAEIASMTDEEYEANRQKIHDYESKIISKDQHAMAEVTYSPASGKQPFVGQDWQDIQTIFGDANQMTAPYRVAFHLSGLSGLDMPDTHSYLQILGKKTPPDSIINDILNEQKSNRGGGDPTAPEPVE